MEYKHQAHDLAYNNSNLKIKGKDGFIDFVGISTMGDKQLYRIGFEDNTSIDATSTHVFFTMDGREIQTRELSIGLEIIGSSEKKIISIEPMEVEMTYDVVESDNHTYVSNGVLSHNCTFLSSDALLINSIWLANKTPEIEAIVPMRVIKDVVFYDDIKRGMTYLIGVDPATGSGEDYSVITIFEFPSLRQVGEYRSNTMSTNGLYGTLRNILALLEKMNTTVYFSVENNGVGEGVIALYEADLLPPENAVFVSEDGKSKRGMTSTARSKMRACVNLKELIEKGSLHVQSRILFAELKAYVRNKGAYAAQSGSTDDCISAVLVVCRLIEEISTFEQAAFDKLYAGEYDEWTGEEIGGEYDDGDSGMPISF